MQTFPWLIATFVPIAVAYVFMARRIISGLSRSVLAEQPWLLALAAGVAAVVTSGMAVLIGQVWAIFVEIVRIGDGHLGYRTQFIPYMQIEFRTFAFGVIGFLVIAAARLFGRARELTDLTS